MKKRVQLYRKPAGELKVGDDILSNVMTLRSVKQVESYNCIGKKPVAMVEVRFVPYENAYPMAATFMAVDDVLVVEESASDV